MKTRSANGALISPLARVRRQFRISRQLFAIFSRLTNPMLKILRRYMQASRFPALMLTQLTIGEPFAGLSHVFHAAQIRLVRRFVLLKKGRYSGCNTGWRT